MTTKAIPPSEAEIQAEIDLLRRMEFEIRPFSAFGDDNRATVMAQREAIERQMTREDVERRWGHQADAEDADRWQTFIEHVEDAVDWRLGVAGVPAPSLGWACLMPGAVLGVPTQLEISRAAH